MTDDPATAAMELNGQTVLVAENGSGHAIIDLLESHGYSVEERDFTTPEGNDSEPLKGYFVSLAE